MLYILSNSCSFVALWYLVSTVVEKKYAGEEWILKETLEAYLFIRTAFIYIIKAHREMREMYYEVGGSTYFGQNVI